MRHSSRILQTALFAALTASIPGAAQAGRAYTYSESSSFSGSIIQRGYNMHGDGFGGIYFGDFGTTQGGGCIPGSGCTISAGGTSDPSPTLFTANSSSMLTDAIYDLPRTATGEAHASLYSGKIGATAIGQPRDCPGYSCGVGSRAIAGLGEITHFTIAGANASTHTGIGISFSIDGSRTANLGATAQAFLRVLSNGGTSGEFLANYADSGDSAVASGWTSYTIDTSTPGLLTFKGIYDLIGATNDLNIGYTLTARSGGGIADYGSTGRFNFVLPTGVTFTSDSGVFLTAGGPGVPEPAAWAMMIIGFGAVGSATRYRRRKLAIHR